MTKSTTTTLIASSTYGLLFVGVLIYAYSSVLAQSREVDSLNAIKSEQVAKESATRSITDIINTTADSRAKLATHFVTEKETISFIAEIESLATVLGVEIETTGLEIIPAKDNVAPKLKTSFSIEGRASAVEQFILAIESLPYHSEIPELSIGMSEGKWEASLHIFVTMKL